MAVRGQPLNVLAIDIGGTHVKFRTQKRSSVVKIESSPKLSAADMVDAVRESTADWNYDHISIGYPGPVVHNLPLLEPHNLGKGWVSFDYKKAFGGKPLRMINDAAMQALGSYRGDRMLFLGLGTGLGSALVVEGVVQAMELAHLPWKKKKTYEEFLGEAALKRDGHKEWQRNVEKAIEMLQPILQCDSVVLGGGNAKLVESLPKDTTLGLNANAFKGAFMLWDPKHASSR